MDIDSSIDVDTTASSILLTSKDETLKQELENCPVTAQSNNQKSILVVDNKIVLGRLFSEHLIQLGYNVNFANTTNNVKDFILQAINSDTVNYDVHLLSVHSANIFELCQQHEIDENIVFVGDNLPAEYASAKQCNSHSLEDIHIFNNSVRFEDLEVIIKSIEPVQSVKVSNTKYA